MCVVALFQLKRQLQRLREASKKSFESGAAAGSKATFMALKHAGLVDPKLQMDFFVEQSDGKNIAAEVAKADLN